jgi:hypothetical protein
VHHRNRVEQVDSVEPVDEFARLGALEEEPPYLRIPPDTRPIGREG